MLSLANSRPAHTTHAISMSNSTVPVLSLANSRPAFLMNNLLTLSPTRNFSNCTFPRLTLHACALTRTISLSYRGISLSFHLVTEVFQLVTRYFTFPVRFQLNSDFSHTFLNGQLTRRTINPDTSFSCYHLRV